MPRSLQAPAAHQRAGVNPPAQPFSLPHGRWRGGPPLPPEEAGPVKVVLTGPALRTGSSAPRHAQWAGGPRPELPLQVTVCPSPATPAPPRSKSQGALRPALEARSGPWRPLTDIRCFALGALFPLPASGPSRSPCTDLPTAVMAKQVLRGQISPREGLGACGAE